jgi:hypothetical protein
VDLKQLLRSDLLGLNTAARRNALVAAAQAARRAEERADVERALVLSEPRPGRTGLRRAL